MPPAERIPCPSLAMTTTWSVDQIIGLLDSWSATHRAHAATAEDPLATVIADLRTTWADAPSRGIR
ncbi:MAG: hypothetical protein J6386_18270 [Candidatus Synoicihabitans palmerolidicus]|nr:hypothetical protein [Candidatus Synoicihabitans palmerolidicus]